MKQLAAPCQYEETIKKSRFVVHAAPVNSQAETLEFYESVADSGATHNCWAWRLDYVHRSNDDGEPSGSAGRPMLATIEGRELNNLMVVVTRYFGGIKLGIGGLIRAYGGCTAKCLDRAEITEVQELSHCLVGVDFSLSSAVHVLFLQLGAEKLSETFDHQGTQLEVSIASKRLAALKSALADLSKGQATLRTISR